MRRKSRRKFQRGLSLVSVLVSGVIAGGVVLMLSSALGQAFKAQQKVTTRLDIENAVAMASRFLNSNLCSESLKGLTFPQAPASLPAVRLSNIELKTPNTGIPLVYVGLTASSRARISRLDLTHFVPLDATNYTADIDMEFTDPVDATAMPIVRFVPLLISTTLEPNSNPPQRRISRCMLKPDSKLEPSGNVVIADHGQPGMGPPGCPDGFSSLWNGYSMLSGGDLSTINSCPEFFVPPASVDFAGGGGTSVVVGTTSSWLSNFVGPQTKAAAETVPAPKPPLASCHALTPQNTIQAQIRRCSACDADGIMIVRHSYTRFPPDCPQHYELLWQGFSLESVGGVNVNLSGPGSCAKQFDYWLGVSLTRNGAPNLGTYSCSALTTSWLRSDYPNGAAYTNLVDLVGRCAVCFRKNPEAAAP